ncbi:MAG: hypothetical protein ACR2II_06905 [Chthoniobacterales bacterium]
MNKAPSRWKLAGDGLFAGAIAGIVMTVVMLLLAWLLGVATPVAIIGDRLSVFIKPGPFLALMGRVGGYNHLKQLGVGSTMAGQILVGAFGGLIYGLTIGGRRRVSSWATLGVFFVLPLLASFALLWPVLGTSYHGWPIRPAAFITILRVGSRLHRVRAHARSRVSFSHRAALHA